MVLDSLKMEFVPKKKFEWMSPYIVALYKKYGDYKH